WATGQDNAGLLLVRCTVEGAGVGGQRTPKSEHGIGEVGQASCLPRAWQARWLPHFPLGRGGVRVLVGDIWGLWGRAPPEVPPGATRPNFPHFCRDQLAEQVENPATAPGRLSLHLHRPALIQSSRGSPNSGP